MGGSWSTRRDPTGARGEHANSTQEVPGPQNRGPLGMYADLCTNVPNKSKVADEISSNQTLATGTVPLSLANRQWYQLEKKSDVMLADMVTDSMSK